MVVRFQPAQGDVAHRRLVQPHDHQEPFVLVYKCAARLSAMNPKQSKQKLNLDTDSKAYGDRVIRTPIVETYGDRVIKTLIVETYGYRAKRKINDVLEERKMIDVDELMKNSSPVCK